MILKSSSSFLRDNDDAPSRASGERAFKFFLLVAVLGCLWTTAIIPYFPSVNAWVARVFGA